MRIKIIDKGVARPYNENVIFFSKIAPCGGMNLYGSFDEQSHDEAVRIGGGSALVARLYTL